jgi:hypothetical protein
MYAPTSFSSGDTLNPVASSLMLERLDIFSLYVENNPLIARALVRLWFGANFSSHAVRKTHICVGQFCDKKL